MREKGGEEAPITLPALRIWPGMVGTAPLRPGRGEGRKRGKEDGGLREILNLHLSSLPD